MWTRTLGYKRLFQVYTKVYHGLQLLGSYTMKHTIQILISLFITLMIASCNQKHEYPKELKYCFEYLNEHWDPQEIEIFKNMSKEDTTPKNYHFGMGRHLRNNLIRNHVYSETLQAYFNRNGIFHQDDMSGIILSSYHKYLNKKDLELEKQFEFYISFWEPILACEKIQDSLAKKYFEDFDLKDTIQVLIPIRGGTGAFDYSCYLDWVFNDSSDLKITGVVVNKNFSDTIDRLNSQLHLLTKSKRDAKVFSRHVQSGDTLSIQLKTSWKLKKMHRKLNFVENQNF